VQTTVIFPSVSDAAPLHLQEEMWTVAWDQHWASLPLTLPSQKTDFMISSGMDVDSQLQWALHTHTHTLSHTHTVWGSYGCVDGSRRDFGLCCCGLAEGLRTALVRLGKNARSGHRSTDPAFALECGTINHYHKCWRSPSHWAGRALLSKRRTASEDEEFLLNSPDFRFQHSSVLPQTGREPIPQYTHTHTHTHTDWKNQRFYTEQNKRLFSRGGRVSLELINRLRLRVFPHFWRCGNNTHTHCSIIPITSQI